VTPETQKAIDRAWQIEQDATSREWATVAQKVLAGLGPIRTRNDPKVLAMVGRAFVVVIDSKASRLMEGVRNVLESYRDLLTEADRIALNNRLDSTLSEDVSYAISALDSVNGPNAQGLADMKGQLKNATDQKRLASMHTFDTMLVAVKNKHAEEAHNHGNISIEGSHNIVGGRIVNAGNRTVQAAPRSGQKRTLPKWLLGIAAAVAAGLIVAYIAWKFGWTK
jgi:hypothetical protein